jgi:hypothetical protein
MFAIKRPPLSHLRSLPFCFQFQFHTTTKNKMATFTANSAHRHEVIPFDAAQDAQVCGSKVIESLISNVPGLKIFTRTSPRFEALRAVYNTLITAQPLVVCRPTTIEQVQGIVKTVAGSGTQIAVRCGGHDVWGRGCVADSVTIDMRELDSQVLAEDKASVTVGGGITSDNFVAFLDTHGLCTAQGTAGHVGWTGWAIWGGYGPFNDYVGLGVDNILEAKVVTADGSLVQADEELLWGIRGAGGNLGVIVETKVRVYPMPKILAGFIGYAWEDAVKVLLGLQELLDQGVPDAFCVQMGFMKSEWGLGATLIFIWPDPDLAEGRKWMDKVTSLGTVVVNTTTESKRFPIGLQPPLTRYVSRSHANLIQPPSVNSKASPPGLSTTQPTSTHAVPPSPSSLPPLSARSPSRSRPSPTPASTTSLPTLGTARAHGPTLPRASGPGLLMSCFTSTRATSRRR